MPFAVLAAKEKKNAMGNRHSKSAMPRVMAGSQARLAMPNWPYLATRKANPASALTSVKLQARPAMETMR